MKKAELATSIEKAQLFFKEAPTKLDKKMQKPLLEALLHTYVARYRATKTFAIVDCHACDLTGIYADNGGPCFRCKGKGFQTEDDQKRNYGYDLHHPRVLPTTAAAVAEVISAEIIQLPLLNEDDIVF